MSGKKQGLVARTRNKISQYIMDLEVVDYRLIISIVFLVMFGIIMIYSASGAKFSLAFKQLLLGLGGLVAMLLISYIDYHVYIKFSGLIYLLSLASLFLVWVPGVGVTKNGASRWVQLGPLGFQPSELLKPAIVILMAGILASVGKQLIYFRADFSVLLPGVLAVIGIRVITKNLSTALIVAGIVAIMFYIAYPTNGIWKAILILFIVAVVFALYYYNTVILEEYRLIQNNIDLNDKDFRSMRILAWLHPNEPILLDRSRQTRYSLYSIGFGGLLGRGLGNGTVKYYLPEPTNDFIFAVVAEELGIVGCSLVIFLFIYQIWRIMTVAHHAKDLTGSYMALGIGIHVAIQVILNIGVATSLLPNTGISLPYISSGGTALLLQLAEMGIVLNISRQIHGRRIRPEADAGNNSGVTTT